MLYLVLVINYLEQKKLGNCLFQIISLLKCALGLKENWAVFILQLSGYSFLGSCINVLQCCFLTQWVSCLLGFWEWGGVGPITINCFCLCVCVCMWLHLPKVYDFLFLVAQHLLGWWCGPGDRWYGNSEAVPTWSWGVDRWDGTCECAPVPVPGQSSNLLSFPKPSELTHGLGSPQNSCWEVPAQPLVTLLCPRHPNGTKGNVTKRIWLPPSHVRGFRHQSPLTPSLILWNEAGRWKNQPSLAKKWGAGSSRSS